MILIKCGRQDAIRWLVTCSGLDLSIRNDAGNTAYSLAQHAGLSHLLPGYSGYDAAGMISSQRSSFASAPSLYNSTSAAEANDSAMPPVVDAVPYDEGVAEEPAYLQEGTAVQHASLLVFASNDNPQQQQQHHSSQSSSNPEERFVGGRLVVYTKCIAVCLKYSSAYSDRAPM
jgi:hypothetical protein